MKIKIRKNKFGQSSFQSSFFKSSYIFGGSLLKKSHAKTKRHIDTKNSIHLVLKSSKAKLAWSFRTVNNQKIVKDILYKTAEKYGIKIEQYANASKHLHLLIRVRNRYTFAPFIRAVTGAIALKITGSSKNLELKEAFWDFRPFTRVVKGYKAKFITQYYVIQNELEAAGFISYRPRERKLSTA
jgi:REP element-mobilizing transposase RayT